MRVGYTGVCTAWHPCNVIYDSVTLISALLIIIIIIIIIVIIM